MITEAKQVTKKLVSDDDINYWVHLIKGLEGEIIYQCPRCGNDKIGFIKKYLPKKYAYCYSCKHSEYIKKKLIIRTEPYDNKIK